MKNNRGIVLISVLVIIFILIIVLYQITKIANIEINTTQILKNFFIAKHRAISGLHIAEAILILEKEKTKLACDTLLSTWNNLNIVQGYLPDDINPEYLDLKIQDETSKIPINYLVDKKKGEIYVKVVKNLLVNELGISENRSDNIIREIKNWINPKKYPLEETEVINPYYKNREYKSKNGTFETLGEMLLLPSVDEKIYYGNKYKKGLKDLFTVYSDDGLININTCSRPIAMSLILNEVDQEKKNKYVDEILKKRYDPFYKEILCDVKWIKKNMSKYKDIEIPYNILTTTSNYFKITSTGISGPYNCTIIRFVKRKNKRLKTLYQIEY